MLDTTLPASGQPVCAWTDASRKFALHLSPDVLRRLATECSTAFEKVPRRGLEIGGLLLGRTKTEGNETAFWVDGFRAVESEHRWGPSYLLSESDFARLQDELGGCGGGCVGTYRSQTRAKQLALDAADVNVFGQCFPTGNALFLMLAPALGRVAFFSRADADLKCVWEFALPATRFQPVRQPRPRLGVAPDIRQRAPVKIPRPTGRRKSWYAAMIAVLLVGAATGLPGFLSRRAAPASSVSRVVDLKVQPAGSTLRLLWDPNSLPLRGAVRVVLHVQDGDYRSDRDLAWPEVRGGSTTYEPRSDEVFLRVDAYSAAPTASGSVRVINYPHHSAVRPAATNLKQPGTSTPVAKEQPQHATPNAMAQITGNAAKVWLGMSLRPVTRDVALAFHLPQPSGLLVTRVDVWSPAGTSGLESGDILLALDAQRIADIQDLELKIREMTQRKTVTMAVFRDGAIHQIEVNVGEIPGRVAQSAAVVAQP